MAVYLHEEDLPAGVLGPGPVAVDTETMGLITPRDRLCLLQISDGGSDEHLVRFGPVFARALAKKPADRFRSCADFARAMQDVLAGPGARHRRTAHPPGGVPVVLRCRPLRRRARRRR